MKAYFVFSNRAGGFRLTGVLIVAATAVAGCSLNHLGRDDVSRMIERNLKSKPVTAERYARVPDVNNASVAGVGQEAVPEKMEAPATLRAFIAAALEHNPDIQSARDRARAKAERVAQVTALPDPVFTTKTLPEPVRTAEGDNFFNLGISQKFPVPEKLDRAGRIALEETRIAIQKLRETRLRVIADVKRAYFGLYAIDKSIEITRDNQDLLRGLIDVARAQVAAGRRAQDDVLRAQVELSNLEAELIDLRQRRVTTVSRLNELLNRDALTSVGTPEDFDIRHTELSIKKLFAAAIERNPTLQRIQQQIERDRQAVHLAKLAYWPDFTLGFEWIKMESRDAFRPPPNPNTGIRPIVSRMSQDGSDNWAINFGFTLPIWYDKIKAGIEEARRNLLASKLQYTSTRNQVYFRVQDALERVRAQRDLAALFRDTIIPQAQQTYQVSQASYMAGTDDFLYVIDNWRKWLVFTIQYYRSLGELERSVADLEQALGVSIAEAGGPS